ncbi:WXG100 family type VII secretion target [Prauserella oleivorans]
MGDGFTSTPEDLATHSATVKALGDRLAKAADTGRGVELGGETYGIIGQAFAGDAKEQIAQTAEAISEMAAGLTDFGEESPRPAGITRRSRTRSRNSSASSGEVMVFTNMEPDKLTAGTGPIDTVYQAAKDINNPEDWAVDGLALGLDALGFIANPLGALAGSVVGFLIEHLEFLKEPLDDLAGDPDAIFAVAAVWGEQVSKECVQIADDYQRAIESEIGSWNGDAAEAYRGKSGQIVEQIRSLEAAAVGVSQAVQGSGQAVATVRGIIRDLIADVVGEILVARPPRWRAAGSRSVGRSRRSPGGRSREVRPRRARSPARSRSCS